MNKSLLLDTCALLWLGNSSERFSPAAIERIETAPYLYASPISLWEIALKWRLGKLQIQMIPEKWFAALKAEYGIIMLPLDESVMNKAAALPLIHKDPADRFIIATALLWDIQVVTGDHRFSVYGVSTVL